MAESSFMKKIAIAGAVAASLSSIGGLAYASLDWADNRYAQNSVMIQNHAETCRKIEQLALRQVQTEIFRLEVKKAESSRMTNQQRQQFQTFSPVDQAMLSRFKAEEREIGARVMQCDKAKP